MAVDKAGNFKQHNVISCLPFKLFFIKLHMDHAVGQVTCKQLLELALAHLDNLASDV
jgi:hypothetical protein